MIQSLLVYVTLAISFVLLCYAHAHDRNKTQKFLNSAIIFYTLIMGLRYGVGKDFLGYKDIYDSYVHFGSFTYALDIGFQWIIRGCAFWNLHYAFFFGIIAFLQIYLLCRAFRSHREIYPYVAYTLMASCIWLSFNNIMRQQLAFCIFVFALQFIIERRWKAYYTCILVACLMHQSAILLAICYPLFIWKKDYFKNITFQYILLGIALILMNINLVQNVISLIEGLATLSNYSRYLDPSSEQDANVLLNENVSLGLGFYILLGINIIQIYYSKRVKQYFESPWFSIAYTLYFAGVLWNYIFISSIIFQRINCYMIGFQFIIGAFTLYYLFRKSRIMFYLLTFLYFLTFTAYMAGIENSYTKYYFIWQEEEFQAPIEK